MDAKYSMTITLSAPSPEELGQLLARVASALEVGGSSEAQGAPRSLPTWGGQVSTPADWYRRNAHHLLQSITDESRRALFYIAENGPVVPVEDVARELGVDRGPALAGTLASIGATTKRLGGQDYPPFKKVRDRYEIDPDVAREVRDAKLKWFPEPGFKRGEPKS